MIDELSLGLAPVVVEQLLGVVRQIRDAGTTVILVEQSVNVALTAADTAYFLEKGEVKFHGPTAELLDRPDVLRAVYLQGTTASVTAAPNGRPGVARTRYRKRQRELAEAPVVLETHGLGKSFATNVVISDLSIALRQGEILGIVGPNGAGKTTLFDLISGFLRPDAGRIELRGRDVTGLGPDRRSKLGLLRSFQDARLFGSLTVHQAVCVALDRKLDVRDPVAAMLHLPEPVAAEKRLSEQADQLIEAMNIAAFRDKFVGELSTGSRRIVDLACILGSEPDVILFDEPSSGIAQREAEALGPLLHDIRERTGASLIVIEHDMPLVTSVADRLIALNLGRFVIEGDANTVLGHPEVVASYLGSNENVIARSGTGKATAPRPAREGPPGRKEPAQA
jgi:branched-chain amino acid transport system ATP-binding protein